MRLLVVFLSMCLTSAILGLEKDRQLPSLPESNLGEQQESDMLFLLVDKSRLRADLKTWPADFRQAENLFSFRIAVGKEEGDKQVEGDNRTPEGIYFAQRIIDGRSLPDRYGPYAIPIDFPNPIDKIWGKTGYGIWLHGVEKDARVEEAKVTEGCVAFYNSDIQSLVDWLRPFHSVVVIAKDAAEVNRPEDIEQVRQLTRSWYESWGQRQHQSYVGYYSDKFKLRGMDLAAFSDYKKRVFNKYDKMEVKIENLRVFTHNRYAVSVMNQYFNGDDRYVSNGRKILYWHKGSDGGWKISHEEFDSRRFEFQTISRDYLVRLFRESPSAKQFARDNATGSSL